MGAGVSQEDFWAILAVSRFGACGTSPDGTVLFWNRRAEQIFGVSASETVGRHWSEVISPVATSETDVHASQPVRLQDRTPAADASAIFTDHSDNSLSIFLFDAAPASPGVSAPYASSSPPSESANRPLQQPLTKREAQILRLLASGISTDQVAADLHLSVHTVRNHIRNTRRKLNAKTMLEAAVIALRRGLV